MKHCKAAEDSAGEGQTSSLSADALQPNDTLFFDLSRLEVCESSAPGS